MEAVDNPPPVKRSFSKKGRSQQVYVPTVDPAGFLRTSDRELYHQGWNGVVRRVTPKVRGKAARRAEKQARRGTAHAQ